MDFQNEVISKNQWTTITRSKYRLLYLRRTLVFLLSASLFSILLSFFTQLSFLHSYAYYFSTFLLPLVTRIFERNCMFLLCNGILVFLAGKSRLCSSSGLPQKAEADDMPQHITNAHQDMILQPLTVVEPVFQVESGTHCTETYMIPQVMLTREQENELLKAEHVQDGEEEEYRAGVAERSDQDEDEASDVDIENDDYGLTAGGQIDTETEGPPSNTEELNKKIEEFIRKMKEELRLEAQQPPLIPA